ncbi:DUF4266 domain-containing protein [Alteromonas sp. McT4-15]|jgi:hypothetical protein|uniref:DUF4266 domain-containing protein n=1 Tax=unclassified Alteromonas TaxID=2614992 RepID=UPI001920AE40|nr:MULTISPECIES: DUF4266 domain-containing protein [unclassified Alteromonas]MEC8232401.1 DUF4266 domain-containing protein [Pseudomonadota bacterium]MCB4434842.1 DUF4266 domain-containing protein [Alteromonas sp. McT4-15]WDT85896.1 DUF4266 domain-containing protein [Alteromonas sp. 009811495]BCO20845.1 hypothetical protein KUC3_37020 [Alteromonas sp. KC3]BCO24815.1 hypothetical protein KUC14_36840 [Alteromonas sp. KC14]
MKKPIQMSALALCSTLLSTGCVSTLEHLSDIEPWVKPYERSHLADPIMSVNRNPIATAYIKHVFEAREGARGADGGAGGGCGCN